MLLTALTQGQINEGVMDYRHTPSNLAALSKKTKPRPSKPEIDDRTYLARHGVKTSPPPKDEILIRPVPPRLHRESYVLKKSERTGGFLNSAL